MIEKWIEKVFGLTGDLFFFFPLWYDDREPG